MSDPSKFYDDFDSAKKLEETSRQASYQEKILKMYFSTMVEKADLHRIFNDSRVSDKLLEVKNLVKNEFFDKIYIHKYKGITLKQVYQNFPSTQPWSDMMKLVSQGEVGIIFPMDYWGNHILHNFSRQSEEVLKKPRIIWPGICGSDLTLEKMDVFVKEYRIGE